MPFDKKIVIPFDGMRVLEVDIETKPAEAYVWALFNQNIGLNQIKSPSEILSYAARWQHQKKMMFKSIYHDGKEEMIEGLWDLLDEADVVVHFNGKRFDIPHINRELIEADYVPPSPYHQIDLYHIVRATFKFQSNRLDWVVQQLLDERKLEHQGMPLWTDCMDGVDAAWRKMRAYNKHDVYLLRGVYLKVLPWITRHPNRALYMKNPSRPTCPNCGNQNLRIRAYRETTTRVNAYVQYFCDPNMKSTVKGKNRGYLGGCGAHPRARCAIKRDRTNILT